MYIHVGIGGDVGTWPDFFNKVKQELSIVNEGNGGNMDYLDKIKSVN